MELLNCPFCGGSAELLSPFDRVGGLHVRCQGCGCLLTGPTPEEVAEAWNRRKEAKPVSVAPLMLILLLVALRLFILGE